MFDIFSGVNPQNNFQWGVFASLLLIILGVYAPAPGGLNVVLLGIGIIILLYIGVGWPVYKFWSEQNYKKEDLARSEKEKIVNKIVINNTNQEIPARKREI